MRTNETGTAAVLVVEDEPGIRALLTRVLENDGYRVKTVGGAFEALHYLETHPAPSLILLDLTLGMTDGRAFRARQSDDPRLAGIPVVLLSGSAHLENEADQLRAAGYLPKPVPMELLRTMVRRYCGEPLSA
jgi:CheY-like chemotaxis protein